MGFSSEAAANLNINVIQRFQNKIFRITVGAPYYVLNMVILQSLPSVMEEIEGNHPNVFATQLLTNNECDVLRLKRYQLTDLVILIIIECWPSNNRRRSEACY